MLLGLESGVCTTEILAVRKSQLRCEMYSEFRDREAETEPLTMTPRKPIWLSRLKLPHLVYAGLTTPRKPLDDRSGQDALLAASITCAWSRW